MNTPLISGESKMEEAKKQLTKLDNELAEQINERKKKINANESINIIDRQISNKLINFNELIQQTKELLKKQNFTPNETQRQKNLLDGFQNRSDQFRKNLETKKNYQFDFQQKENDYSEKSNIELGQLQKQKMAEQDQTIDRMIQTTTNIGNNVKNINMALDEDKVILVRLNDQVEQATHEIKVTDSNLKSLLQYTSDCCLWTAIIVEFMIFVFLVIY